MSTGLYSGSFGLSFGTGLYKTRLGLFSSASGLITGTGPTPALSLYFLSGNTLDPRITFSRGTNATLIDSTGQLTYAPSNVLVNSEGFDTTSWATKQFLTVTANATASPDGTITADKLVEDITNNGHFIAQSYTYTSGTSYTYSVYAKAAERQYIQLVTGLASFGANLVAGFDLSGDGSTVVSATATSSITAVGNGWYRCSITATATASVASQPQIRIANSLSTTASSYLGDGSGVYVWGAQLGAVTYETAPRTYNNTSLKNMLGYTEEFDNTAWTKTSSAVTANATNDPNGFLNADKLTELATNSSHNVNQASSFIAGTSYTYSVYAKAAERQYIQIVHITTAFPVITIGVFDLSGAGATNVTSTAGASSSITFVGNGWYRCSLTATASVTTLANPQIRVTTSFGISNASSTYMGTVGSGAYIWGAQLASSGSMDPYVYNPVAALTSAAYYGPRFDYDPITLNPLGLLIEEARTNLLLNSDTLSTQNITTTAQAYTLSFYGTGTVTLSGTSTAGPLVGTGVFPNRASLTFTPTAGTLTLTVSGTVSNAQLEAGGFRTSYIFTAGASVTRSADVATMVGNNFSNWYNQTTGTLAVAFDASANSTATYVSASNGTITQNSLHIDNDTGNMRAVYYSGGTAVATIGLTAIGTVGAVNRIATAYAVNDFAASRNGVLGTSITSGALPVSLTQLNIGVDDRLTAQYYTSNHIKSISYYNTRLTNAQLQAVSA